MSLSSVGIRRATRADAPALDRVESGASARPSPGRDWGLFSESREHFIYLAEDEQVFGFVCAGTPSDVDVAGAGTGELFGLYLLPTHQGHGMGRKLLVRGLSVLKRRGFERGFMWVPRDARPVRHIAARLGFEPAGTQRATNTRAGELDEIGLVISLDEWF